MKEFKKTNKYDFWCSPISLIILLAIFSFSIFKIINLIQTQRETARNKELILNEIDSLRQREKILNADIAKMNTEEGIEDAIREKYQVVKEGEKMIVIIDENTNLQAENSEPTNQSFGNWIKGIFKN